MAHNSSVDQMTVTSDNQDLRGFTNKDSLDQRANYYSTKPLIDNVPKKKSTFKITSIKMSDDGDEDIDESHNEKKGDYSSDTLELSRGEETSSMSEDMPYPLIRSASQNGSKEKADMHSRFRVVKIESKEPFKRGRWTCHDCLDPAPVNLERSETKVSQDDANSDGSSVSSSENFVTSVDDIAKHSLQACDSMTAKMEEEKYSGCIAGFQPIHPAVNTTAIQPVILNNTLGQVSSLGYGSMSGGHFSQISSGGYASDVSQGQSIPSSCQMVNKSMSFQSINSINPLDSSVQQMKYIVPSGSQLGEIPSGLIQHGSSQLISGKIDVNASNIPPAALMPHFPTGLDSQQQMSASFPSSVHMSGDVNSSIIPIQNQAHISGTFQTYVHLGGQQIPNPVTSKSETVLSVGDISIPKTGADHFMLDVAINQCNCDKASDQDQIVMPNSETLSPALVAAVIDLQEEEKSGSSTVAIDNKIEQAMDLVKSHLMFAVREEVEVLKEQITELIERNNQLEYENGILRAAATPETLAKLALPHQQPPSSSSS